MNFMQFFLILRARYKVILVTFAVVVSAAIIVSLLWPKSYKATATILLNSKGIDPVTGFALPAQLMPGYMATQTDIIQSQRVAVNVVEKLGLAKSAQVQSDFMDATDGKGDINAYIADLLLKGVDATPSRESNIIEISFKGQNPEFAATIANSFADAYLDANVQLKVEPAKKAAVYFEQQIKSLRKNLEEAQSKLAKYQQDKGITSIDDRLDIESARLSELSGQLSLAQASSIEANSRNANAQKGGLNSPDVSQSPVVQSLKIDLARSESKLADISQRVGKNHPEYLSAASELENLKTQLKLEIQRASENISGTARIGQARESELREQVAIQKEKVLELNHVRAEMMVLQRDVQSAQEAMSAVTQRFSQTNIEGQSNQSDISILDYARPPLTPSSPKVMLVILISVFFGGILGITFAFIAELLDKRVRSKDDLVGILEVPVFAVISTKKTEKNKVIPKKLQKLLNPA